MSCTRSRSIEQQMVDAVIAAANLPLDDLEYEAALDAVTYYASTLDAAEGVPPNFAARVIEEIEWALGLGLDEQQLNAAVAAAQQAAAGVTRPRPPDPEPDAFLEMAYEDRVSGDLGDWYP